jgi:hypothetical protein
VCVPRSLLTTAWKGFAFHILGDVSSGLPLFAIPAARAAGRHVADLFFVQKDVGILEQASSVSVLVAK